MGNDYYYTDDVEREINNLGNDNRRPSHYGLAVVSLVLGLVSLVFFLFLLNIITGIAAIVFGITFLVGTRKGDKGRGFAKIGIITSILSIVLCIGSYIMIFQNADNISRMLENELKNNDSQFHYYEYDNEDPFKGFDDIEDFYNFDGKSEDIDDFLNGGDDTL